MLLEAVISNTGLWHSLVGRHEGDAEEVRKDVTLEVLSIQEQN